MSFRDKIIQIVDAETNKVLGDVIGTRFAQTITIQQSAGTILSKPSPDTATVQLVDGSVITANLGAVFRAVGDPVFVVSGIVF